MKQLQSKINQVQRSQQLTNASVGSQRQVNSVNNRVMAIGEGVNSAQTVPSDAAAMAQQHPPQVIQVQVSKLETES